MLLLFYFVAWARGLVDSPAMVTSSPVMTAPGLTANFKKRITPLTSADESMETLVVPVTFASTRPAISTLGALISPVNVPPSKILTTLLSCSWHMTEPLTVPAMTSSWQKVMSPLRMVPAATRLVAEFRLFFEFIDSNPGGRSSI